MSLAEVTSRIAEIQGHIQSISARFEAAGAAATRGSAAAATSATAGTPSASGVDFSRVLEQVTGSTSGQGGQGAGQEVVTEAKKYLGLPYVWGGTDPDKGLDCSGLVQLVYKELGYDLPRVSYQQAASGRPVKSLDQAQPGDILAWDNSSRNKGVDHVAIYIGDGKMIEAPRTGLDVRITEVTKTPTAIRRIVPDATTGSASASMTSAAALGSTATGQNPGGLTLGDYLNGLGGLGNGLQTLPTSLPTAPATGTTGASGVSASRYDSLFVSAGTRYGVPPQLLAAVAQQESSFNPKAVSPAGAQGLMQLMPATARSLGVTDPFDPIQSVNGAAKLLSTLLERFGSTDLALAAYNAGPGAVIRHDGVPPYAETQNYIRSITAKLGATQ